jgi:two-component system, NarL family, sensor histidine kinase DegS
MDYEQEEQLAVDPKQEIINLISEAMTSNKRKLTEIKAQVEQQQINVDREQQRYTDIAAELSNIHHNLDTVPRQDIRDKYDEALNTRTRLLTMRGQLEKFETSYQQLQEQQQLLSSLLGKVQGGLVIEDTTEEGDNLSRGGLNIVRIVQAQEDERQRLARQMHDGPAQSLTNFILQAEICQRLFDRNPDRAAEELNNLKTAASITFQKVRDFIFDLRPMMLDDLGVIPTVRRYVSSFKDKNDIEVELDITGEERRLESHREVLLFRAIQELMTHTRDYASATRMKIRLDMTSNIVKVLIEDNGRGFDASLVNSPEDTHQDGRVQSLVTLREKYELVNGKVVVQSGESEGTTVRLELPTGE